MRRSGIPLIAQHIAHAEITQPRLRQWSLIAYGITLDFASIGLIVGALLSGYRLGAVIPTSIMAIATFAGEKQSIRVGPNLEASAGFLPGLFTAVALGPISAMLVVVVGLLANLGRPWTRWFVWTGSCCLIYGIAGIISNLFQNTRSLDILFLMICTAAIVIVGGQALFGSITLLIRRSLSGIGNHLITIVRVSTLSMIIYVPVVTGLLYVYVSLSSWAVVLFIGPAVAAQRYFVLYRSQRETAIELTKAIKQLERVNLSFATALVTALDARDHYTAGHSATVAVYAKDIANAMGLEEEDQEKAHICGLLHDIGKIGVPTGVLEKKGPLNEGERKAIEGHTDVGASILSRIAGYEEIAVAVRHHHERFDGSGYPRKISGESIPLLARIVAVADAYSAMTSERPYRVALDSEEARERLRSGSGIQFDPIIVDAFIAVLNAEGAIYAEANDRNFEEEIAGILKRQSSDTFALS